MWINDADKVRAIVGSVSDEYSKRIIASTMTEAKSPEQISSEQHIPVSTCYRRIHDLLVLSIIRVDKIDLASGKKSVLYRSTYKNILIKFEANELRVDLVPNADGDDLNSQNGTIETINENDVNHAIPQSGLVGDCDLCQTKNAVCKIFVTGDSKSYLSVCQKCERKMHERNTIKAVEATTHERLTQAVLNRTR
jgi:hypothetical protein